MSGRRLTIICFRRGCVRRVFELSGNKLKNRQCGLVVFLVVICFANKQVGIIGPFAGWMKFHNNR